MAAEERWINRAIHYMVVRSQARSEMDAWYAGLEDIYCPSIVLRRKGSGIGIFRGSTRLGVFAEEHHTFTRAGDGMVVTSVEVDYDPPEG